MRDGGPEASQAAIRSVIPLVRPRDAGGCASALARSVGSPVARGALLPRTAERKEITMKMCKLVSALPIVAMAACFLLLGCAVGTEPPTAAEVQEANAEGALSTSYAPPFQTQPGTWRMIGNEECFDMCSKPNCNCVPFCPGQPQTGGACQTTQRKECYSRLSKGSMSLTSWTCVAIPK